MDREYDFEGRCSVCSKRIGLKLTRISNNSLQLKSAECPEHPNKSVVLWPQREDIVEVPLAVQCDTWLTCPICDKSGSALWMTKRAEDNAYLCANDGGVLS